MLSQQIIIATIISLLFSGSSTSGCRTKQNMNSHDNSSPTPQTARENGTSDELKVLVEGFHSSITNPFVSVVRDDQTYSSLVKLEGSLPKLDADFFKSNIAIAAFLGQRNTGGYSVEINREQNGQIRVSEKAPGKGMMVPQMITSPFKLVSVMTEGTAAVSLSLGEAFQRQAQLYRVTSGMFTVSGGFTGRSESFQLAGKLQVTRLGDLITMGFAVVSSGIARERTLRDTATGTITDGRIMIDKLSHGSLLDPPSGELHVSGTFADKNKLHLDIASAQINVPENYSGKGSIEAEIVAASANSFEFEINERPKLAILE